MNTNQPTAGSRLSACAGLIFLALLNSSWPAALAAPVTSKEAATAVVGWLTLDRAPLGETLGGTVQRVDTFNGEDGNPAYYVVYLDPSGFVIAAADDLLDPIGGFASAGHLAPSENTPLGALVSTALPPRPPYARQMSAPSPNT